MDVSSSSSSGCSRRHMSNRRHRIRNAWTSCCEPGLRLMNHQDMAYCEHSAWITNDHHVYRVRPFTIAPLHTAMLVAAGPATLGCLN